MFKKGQRTITVIRGIRTSKDDTYLEEQGNGVSAEQQTFPVASSGVLRLMEPERRVRTTKDGYCPK